MSGYTNIFPLKYSGAQAEYFVEILMKTQIPLKLDISGRVNCSYSSDAGGEHKTLLIMKSSHPHRSLNMLTNRGEKKITPLISRCHSNSSLSTAITQGHGCHCDMKLLQWNSTVRLRPKVLGPRSKLQKKQKKSRTGRLRTEKATNKHLR